MKRTRSLVQRSLSDVKIKLNAISLDIELDPGVIAASNALIRARQKATDRLAPARRDLEEEQAALEVERLCTISHLPARLIVQNGSSRS